MPDTQGTAPRRLRDARWAEVMAAWTGALRGYLRRTRAEPCDVDEMVADVWALALQAEEGVLLAEHPWAVLRPLARMVARRWVRRARHEQPLEDATIATASVGWIAEHVAERPDLSEARQEWLATALVHLSGQQHDVIERRYLRGWVDPKIASELAISESTVRVHAKRGLDRLRAFARVYPPPA